jgi:hypothetical protein
VCYASIAVYGRGMAPESPLIVELPLDGAVHVQFQDEPPPAEVAVRPLPADDAGRIEAPDAGQVVMSVLSPEGLVRESDEVRRVIDEAGTGDEPLVVVVEAAEELREDELAAILDPARASRRPVILRIVADA